MTTEAIPVEPDPLPGGARPVPRAPTAPQQELWMAAKVGGDDANRAFNGCLSLTLRGDLNTDLLAAAWQTLTDRHEALRCGFTSDGQGLTILAERRSTLARHDLSELGAEARARRLDELFRAEVLTPFDLERAPLCRTSLVRLEPRLHKLVFCAHEAVCDAGSAGVLLRELAALYRVGLSRWPVPPTPADAGLGPAPTFASYASSLRARAARPEGAADEVYWLERLSGPLKTLDLPTDRLYPARRTYAASRLDLPLEPGLTEALRRLGAEAGHPFDVALRAAFQVWLARLTGQRDLIVALPAAGQAVAGAEALVGHAGHVLPLRTAVEPSATFSGHLAATRAALREALEHQQVTLGGLVRRLNVPFDPSRIPLVPVCINVEAAPPRLDFGPLEATAETVPRAFETFELSVNAVDHGDRVTVEWSYATALFDEATVRRWMRELETLVADVAARPATPLKNLALLGPDELALLAELNARERPLAGTPVHARVAAQAAQHPRKIAVRFGGKDLSYAELDRRANQLAHRLRKQGIRARDCVGVCLERSEQLPIALLAVLKCGAAYVPMDPGYPAARLAMMAEDARVRIVVTETAAASAAPPVETLIRLDSLAGELGAEPDEPPAVTVSGAERAYVLFTSGSTGRPKGVEIPHRALENFQVSMQREPGFTGDDRLLAVTTISFDIAGLEMFLPLVSGGTVIIASRRDASDPDALAKLLEAENITVMQATPATWRMLLDAGWSGRRSLRLLVGGEPLPESLLAALGDRVGEIWNMYGPTETTIWSTVKQVRPGARITIGKPIDNTRVYVLDADLAQVPIGATGELWIAGEGVALGYAGRDELTRERFVPDPFVPGQRMYRTGDLGRVLADGDLDCLGRSDFQVKIRGFRIELGEIEAVLERFPGVRKGVVNVFSRPGGDAQLAAYFVAEADRTLDTDALKAHLSAALPPYMVPQQFVALEALPLTPAGKVDRKALPAPVIVSRAAGAGAAGAGAAGGGEALRDDVDVAVAEIWQDLLGVPEIGLDDDFFALGGQSLLAVRFVNTVEARLGVPFSLAGLFAGPSLRAVADAVRGGGGNFETGAVVLRKEPGAPRMFFICGVHLYRTAAQSLGQGIESYGVVVSADEQLTAALRNGGAPKVDVGALVVEYLAAVRKVQPHGPYHLAGVSFGGVLAYEIARRLREAGEEVRTLALLDTILPASMRPDRRAQLQRLVNKDGLLNLGRKLARKILDPGSGKQPAPADETAAADKLGKLRDAAYDDAMAAWEKSALPYAGDTILFRATDKSEYPGMTIDPDLGWRRLMRGRFEIRDLPGNHLGILRDPNVAELAAVLRKCVLAPGG
ncbi:MAG TPA: amino acid adenylation domain-containing protein [Polyangia bacterium]|jgi:amino acid adenylation domain-containing protein